MAEIEKKKKKILPRRKVITRKVTRTVRRSSAADEEIKERLLAELQAEKEARRADNRMFKKQRIEAARKEAAMKECQQMYKHPNILLHHVEKRIGVTIDSNFNTETYYKDESGARMVGGSEEFRESFKKDPGIKELMEMNPAKGSGTPKLVTGAVPQPGHSKQRSERSLERFEGPESAKIDLTNEKNLTDFTAYLGQSHDLEKAATA